MSKTKKATSMKGIYNEMMKTSKSFRETTPRSRETRVKRIHTLRLKKPKCHWELAFRVRPGKLEVASATTKTGVMSNVKNLRKFGLKKGTSSTSLKSGEYYYKKICKVR